MVDRKRLSLTAQANALCFNWREIPVLRQIVL
jgi:hypothetical protein